jgi:hypothetical protein
MKLDAEIVGLRRGNAPDGRPETRGPLLPGVTCCDEGENLIMVTVTV